MSLAVLSVPALLISGLLMASCPPAPPKQPKPPPTTTTTAPPTTTTAPPTTTTAPPTTTTAPPTTTTAPPTTTTAPGGPQQPIPSNFDTAPYLIRDSNSNAGLSSDVTGNFRLHCSFSHLAYADPIVFPGQSRVGHLHMFFGNRGTNGNSTYQSLRGSGDGSCQGGPLNRSAYWAPAMLDGAGSVVIPDTMAVYYKGNGPTAAEIGAMPDLPNGLRFIAGYDMANPTAPSHLSWYCEDTPSAKSQTIPKNCAATDQIGVQLQSPQCWNGRDLDSGNHRSHMAYYYYNNGKLACPSTHPIFLPEFTLTIFWRNDGNTANWHLSSDRMPGMTHANGSTFHSDWFGAWDPGIQTMWRTKCINQLRNCVFAQLGDGSRMIGGYTYTGSKHVPVPPM